MGTEVFGAVSVGGALSDIGRGLHEAFEMFWETLWALVAGFGLSGAVQAFVSREQMQRRLGGHGPAGVGRAALYGMVSSSCSYAASAMARSLVAKGADFVSAMVFMFASTNLVIELGIVLLVLIGWQFLAAEFLGGVVMIGLLVVAGSLWLRGRALARARAAAADLGDDDRWEPGMAHGESEPIAWRRRIRSAGGWGDAAAYTMRDLRMLRREIVIGFAVAGFLAVLVPARVWGDLFLRGHGVWTTIENVVVGPLVAVVSFVCSIGNVPLAAALWKGGIGFGGVMAFVFADLVSLPLLGIYRKQYGGRMALRLLGVFWLVMSLAGLVTGYLFQAAGWVPVRRPVVVADHAFGWNVTTVLDVVALGVFAAMYWLYRNRERLGAGAGYAQDPVCGMQVESVRAPARALRAGRWVYFCSERCRDRFVAQADPRLETPAPSSR